MHESALLQTRLSAMAENLIGSEILRISAEINAKRKSGAEIYNLTIGDFDPAIFPIPDKFSELIGKAYQSGHTNYPPANGIPELREAIASIHKRLQKLDYSPDEILVAGG